MSPSPRGLGGSSESHMKAVILLGINGLRFSPPLPSLGSFRLTLVDGQKHLKSLLSPRNVVCVEDRPRLKRSLEVAVRDPRSVGGRGRRPRFLPCVLEATQLPDDIGFRAGDMNV